MTIQKELTAIKKDITAISKKLEMLLKAVEKSETKVAKPSKTKAVKATPVKKAPVKKKAAKPTATDQVLGIINRSKRGVDAAALVKKTGFNLKKVRNILHRTYKQGRLKRVGKGVYVRA